MLDEADEYLIGLCIRCYAADCQGILRYPIIQRYTRVWEVEIQSVYGNIFEHPGTQEYTPVDWENGNTCIKCGGVIR